LIDTSLDSVELSRHARSLTRPGGILSDKVILS
jgi:hypothetical protein